MEGTASVGASNLGYFHTGCWSSEVCFLRNCRRPLLVRLSGNVHCPMQMTVDFLGCDKGQRDRRGCKLGLRSQARELCAGRYLSFRGQLGRSWGVVEYLRDSIRWRPSCLGLSLFQSSGAKRRTREPVKMVVGSLSGEEYI